MKSYYSTLNIAIINTICRLWSVTLNEVYSLQGKENPNFSNASRSRRSDLGFLQVPPLKMSKIFGTVYDNVLEKLDKKVYQDPPKYRATNFPFNVETPTGPSLLCNSRTLIRSWYGPVSSASLSSKTNWFAIALSCLCLSISTDHSRSSSSEIPLSKSPTNLNKKSMVFRWNEENNTVFFPLEKT